MAFTAGEITNIANAALDYYLDKGDVWRQTLQKRPLMDKLVSRKKYFPGGKGNISVAVSGDFGDGGVNDTLKGYTHNDTVVFYTPATSKARQLPLARAPHRFGADPYRAQNRRHLCRRSGLQR